jgi:F-type H+-transporting ATPase subunit b
LLSVIEAVAASGAEGETPSVLAIPLDEFILGTIAFFIVFFALWKWALPPIQATLKDRTDAIEGGLQRAADAEAQAKAMLEQYRARLAGAHDEAATIRAKAESDGKAIIEEAKARAEQERATIAQRGETQLAAERTQAVASLRQDVGGLAVNLAGRIVGESLDDDARARAVVDRFIADLEQATVKDQA